MKNIKRAIWLIPVVLTVLWLMADTLMPEPFNYFSFRGVFVQYTGVIGISLMSIAMLLAIRPMWLERHFNGLDKMYRLHKWLGIGGLAVSILHWWWAQGTKWMVGWGWLARPERRPRAPGGDLPAIQQWFMDQRGLAESLGEWTFYAAALLIILALIKTFPYHWFKKTHTLLAITYLILVFHSVVLTSFNYWSQPIGWVTAVLMLVGVLSAIVVLTRQIGRKRKVQGTIQSLITYRKLNVVEGTIKLEEGWQGHTPGQFAFVYSNSKEGPHPYTIASAWDERERTLTFIVKALGDWTSKLGQRLKEGMDVTVEGPYGYFNFKDDCPGQIWIGAGIGVTPFIAKMKHLAKQPGHKSISLYHPTADYDQSAVDKLAADALAAKVKLHILESPKNGLLTPGQIRKDNPDWLNASVWFCGPAKFGEMMKKDFIQHGMRAENFHQELFEMR